MRIKVPGILQKKSDWTWQRSSCASYLMNRGNKSLRVNVRSLCVNDRNVRVKSQRMGVKHLVHAKYVNVNLYFSMRIIIYACATGPLVGELLRSMHILGVLKINVHFWMYGSHLKRDSASANLSLFLKYTVKVTKSTRYVTKLPIKNYFILKYEICCYCFDSNWIRPRILQVNRVTADIYMCLQDLGLSDLQTPIY